MLHVADEACVRVHVADVESLDLEPSISRARGEATLECKMECTSRDRAVDAEIHATTRISDGETPSRVEGVSCDETRDADGLSRYTADGTGAWMCFRTRDCVMHAF